MHFNISPIKILSVLSLLFVFSSFQGVEDEKENLERTKDWKEVINKDGVAISYKFIDCHFTSDGLHQEWVILKFDNQSNQSKKIEWKSELWYNGECRTCDVQTKEYNKSITVAPSSTLEGKCSLTENRELQIFSKFLDMKNRSVLTYFNLGDLTITDIEE